VRSRHESPSKSALLVMLDVLGLDFCNHRRSLARWHGGVGLADK
jgi:hypothetical protein